MTRATSRMPDRLIVLRHVDGARWCVVEHMFHEGKRMFAARIATAREYAPACKVALDAAKRAKLPLAIEGNGQRLRPFAFHRDMPRKGAPV